MKIALIGYGKMGREIESIAFERKHEIVLKIDRNNLSDFDKLSQADVAIEFTSPETAIDNIYKCFSSNIPVVVGSTGWLGKLDEVKSICESKGQSLLYASNFSIGVNLFFELNKHLARIMNNYPDYDVMLEEIHHVHKKDSPSGTGLTLLNCLIENLDSKSSWAEDKVNSNDEVLVKAYRMGEVPGTHIVRYFSNVDDIEIKHVAHNRKGFALGAVIAAEWLLGKKGVYGMKDVLSYK